MLELQDVSTRFSGLVNPSARTCRTFADRPGKNRTASRIGRSQRGFALLHRRSAGHRRCTRTSIIGGSAKDGHGVRGPPAAAIDADSWPHAEEEFP